MPTLKEKLSVLQRRADAALDRFLPSAELAPERLHQAMRYAALAPGKRIRPVFVFATGNAVGAPDASLDRPAAAVECIHAYSLIHDDLPAMDDDDLRRGRPTCHVEYDEATAILAGDALQALAFEILLNDSSSDSGAGTRLEMAATLARASGSTGMAGGQALDLAAVGQLLDIESLETIHRYKTGALIAASVRLGYLAASERDAALDDSLQRYAYCIGLAFQVQDDILDVEGDTAVIGKPQGSDAGLDKPTYPNLLGMAQAKKTAHDLCEEAMTCLDVLGGRAETLRDIARFVVTRDR